MGVWTDLRVALLALVGGVVVLAIGSWCGLPMILIGLIEWAVGTLIGWWAFHHKDQ